MFGKKKKTTVEITRQQVELLEKLVEQETERKHKEYVDAFISMIKPYAKDRGVCAKCEGKMKLSQGTTIADYTQYYKSFTVTFVCRTNDDREILILKCPDCRAGQVMWTKDAEVK